MFNTLQLIIFAHFVGSKCVWGDSERSSAQEEIRVIKLRIWRSHIPINGRSTYNQVPSILELLQQDGKFHDIDYSNSALSGSTPFMKHCDRLNILSQSFHINETENPWYHDEELKTKIRLGYDYITYGAPQNEDSNWWGHQIGLPLKMHVGLVLMETELSPAVVSDALRRYWQDTKVWNVDDTKGTNGGSNFAYRAHLGIVEALLRGENEFIRRHSEVIVGINRELVDRRGYNEAGVRADSCLHQHNIGRTYSMGAYTNFTRHQIYNGEYNGILTQLSRVAVFLANTTFRLSDSAVDTLHEALLDCHQWFAWNTAFEPTVCGRKITNNAPVTLWSARTANEIATMLLPFHRRTNELENMIDRYGKKRPAPGTELIGNKPLFRSDMMVQQRSRYMASVRMLSERTIRPETWPNTPHNPKGYYLGDGFLTIMNHGLEYGKKNEEIFQVYDWEHIPGSIVEYSGSPPEYKTTGGDFLAYATGLHPFTGSASSGKYGVAGMTYERFQVNVTAKKVWVFLNDEIVVLATEIDASEAKDTRPVLATLNQVVQHGNVTVRYEGDKVFSFDKGEHTFKQPVWVHHDDNAYVFLDGFPDVVTRANERSSANIKSPIDVFTAFSNLGFNPVGVRFAYVVKPATSTLTEADDYARDLPVSIVQNDGSAQAVHHKALRTSGIVFHEPSTVTFPTGTEVSVNIPCFMVILENERYTFAVSNPDKNGNTVKVRINRKLLGEGSSYDDVTGVSTLTFLLPSGYHGGQSIVKSFSRG